MAIKTKMNKKTPGNIVSKKSQNASDDSLKQGKKRQKPKTDDKYDKLSNIVMDKKRLKSGKSNLKGVPKKPIGVDIKTTDAKATKSTKAAGRSSKINNNANKANDKPKKRTRLSKIKKLSSINKSTSISESPKVDIPHQVNKKFPNVNPNQRLVVQKVKRSNKTKFIRKSNVVELMKLVIPFRDYEVRISDVMRSNMEARDFCRG